MSKTDATQDRINNRLAQQYTFWFDGDGGTTEFRLPKSIGRIDDIQVSVNGAINRPAQNGSANDYKVRGITPGYNGDKNAIKFSAPPPNGQHICVILNAT